LTTYLLRSPFSSGEPGYAVRSISTNPSTPPKDLSVSQAASRINLTESAFYKFIKRHTKKHFTQIVNEFRINHAVKLLVSTKQPIAEICFEREH